MELGRAGTVSLAQPPPPSIVLFIDLQNNVDPIVIFVAVAAIAFVAGMGIAAYLYNRQRKIRKYKLQKAQEAAAMKLNTPP